MGGLLGRRPARAWCRAPGRVGARRFTWRCLRVAPRPAGRRPFGMAGVDLSAVMAELEASFALVRSDSADGA